MSLTRVAIEEFPGIRLDQDPEQLGLAGARDCVNCVVRENGMLETRPGYANLPGAALPDNPATFAMGVRAGPTILDSSSFVIVGMAAGTGMRAIKRSDGSTVGGTIAGFAPRGYADMGTAGKWMTFVTDATLGIRYFDGAVWAGPVGPAAAHLAAWQDQLRLVAGNTANSSRVQFSAVGDGTTWAAGDFVDLTPSDGDQITAVVAWREYCIVFKTRRFFVFYGIGSTASGVADPNWRIVDTGIGCVGIYNGSAVAAPEGVYFLGPDGVYITSGGPAVKISGQLDAWIRPEAVPSSDPSALSRFATSPFTISATGTGKLLSGQLAWLDGVLYWRPALAGTRPDLFSWDGSNWRRHQFPSTLLCDIVALTNDGRHELVSADSATLRLISWEPRDANVSTDQGSVAIAWAYDIGPYRVGGREAERVRRTRVLGSGANITMRMAGDEADPQTDVTPATLAWPSGEWGEAWSNRAYLSRYDSLFSTRLEGSGKMTVHRVEHQVG